MHNSTHAVIPKRCSLYKQPRSERWYACIKMDDGTRYRVSTKKLELEKAKSCTLVLYYEATIKGKNKLHQIDVADADTKRAALELMLASSASVVSLAKKMTKPNTKTVTRTVSIPKK